MFMITLRLGFIVWNKAIEMIGEHFIAEGSILHFILKDASLKIIFQIKKNILKSSGMEWSIMVHSIGS